MTELQALRLSNAQWRLKCACHQHEKKGDYATEFELFKAAAALAKVAQDIDPRLYADDHFDNDAIPPNPPGRLPGNAQDAA